MKYGFPEPRDHHMHWYLEAKNSGKSGIRGKSGLFWKWIPRNGIAQTQYVCDSGKSRIREKIVTFLEMGSSERDHTNTINDC